MNYNFGYRLILGLLPVTLIALAAATFTGCENTQLRETAFWYGGYKAAAEVVENHEANREAVQFVIDGIDVLLGENEVAYRMIEDWWSEAKTLIEMEPVEMGLIEQLFIVPAWERLKAKYGGVKLDLTNEQVASDLRAFQRGLRMALASL